MNPLALAGQSQSDTNLSRLISLSMIDENGNDLSISSAVNHPYRFVFYLIFIIFRFLNRMI